MELSNLQCGLIFAGIIIGVMLVLLVLEKALDKKHDSDEEAKKG